MPADAFASEKTFLIESLMWGMLDYYPVSQDCISRLDFRRWIPYNPFPSDSFV